MKRAYTIIALALCNMIFASNIVAQESRNKEEKAFSSGLKAERQQAFQLSNLTNPHCR